MIETKKLLIQLKNLNNTSNFKECENLLNQISKQPDITTELFKKIKSSYIKDPGWLMVGADFSSLEDRISALTTRDPNKLKVYTGLHIYELNINGTIHHIREDDIINFDGKTYTGEEFYETYRLL